jgi:RNA-directed DNA polymerase
MQQPFPEQRKWLKQVVTGYFNYHAVPTNGPTLTPFRFHITNLWRGEVRGMDNEGADRAVGP